MLKSYEMLPEISWSRNLESNTPNNSLFKSKKAIKLIPFIKNSELVVTEEFVNLSLSNLLFSFALKSK